ncbi:MAG: tRNA (adenosine(37)-N6)-threonylcarbamoyltransferase complex ATPase subunit type 1 TsaE [Actinobacteria bacterium QS_8_72_14]|nr:MAG: tRNA (adenosine(37)-N6)-threonylcarbamoyltransferase complex ATPase subunit type 1 TsaE [Actinobacteria bacterium QS_8_72_14]
MTARLTLRTSGPRDTRALAAALAEAFESGDVVSLTGELGAGKTCFVQGAARGLGVSTRVTSPSFLLRRDYEGRVGVVHLDVYRLDDLGPAVAGGSPGGRAARARLGRR